VCVSVKRLVPLHLLCGASVQPYFDNVRECDQDVRIGCTMAEVEAMEMKKEEEEMKKKLRFEQLL
jgi:hypothetical protein